MPPSAKRRRGYSNASAGSAVAPARKEHAPERAEARPVLSAPNKIREACSQLQAVLKESHSNIKPIDLTLGDPTKFGSRFHPPRTLIDGVVLAAQSGNHHGYTAAVGSDEARQAIAEAHGVKSKDDVIISGGCGASLDLVVRASCGRGDVILLPRPGFPLYETSARIAGVKFEYYNLSEKDNFQSVDLNELQTRLATGALPNAENVKCVVVNSPSNPCGSVFTKEHLVEIARFIKVHFPNAMILSDEVYSDVVFKQGCTFASMGKDFARLMGVNVVVISGISKNWHAPGWRLGWCVIHEAQPGAMADFRIAARNLAGTTMGACTLVQAALPSVLVPRTEEVAQELNAFRMQRDENLREAVSALKHELGNAPGLQFVEPYGAMYMFIRVPRGWSSTAEFCSAIAREQRLLLLSSQCFGIESYIRISIAAPAEVLREAVQRLNAFCLEHPCSGL